MISQENVTLTDLSLIGAGGHGKVVIDTLLYLSDRHFSIYDSAVDKIGSQIHCVVVSALVSTLPKGDFHIAVGTNHIRRNLYEQYCHFADYVSIISPRAYVARSSSLSQGVFVAPHSVIAADSKVGIGCIINHGAIIDHDCQIGEFCHIAPNATLLGGVRLGDNVFIGAGATILPGVFICDNVTVGAGSVVLSDINEKCVVVGSPARKIKG